jgi:hypothetical protein
MGLEIYNLETKDKVFHISDADMNHFEAIFDIFNLKYNDLIDLYGDFRLYVNHQEFLKDAIESIHIKENVLIEFINVLNKCLSQDVVLLVKGD